MNSSAQGFYVAGFHLYGQAKKLQGSETKNCSSNISASVLQTAHLSNESHCERYHINNQKWLTKFGMNFRAGDSGTTHIYAVSWKFWFVLGSEQDLYHINQKNPLSLRNIGKENLMVFPPTNLPDTIPFIVQKSTCCSETLNLFSALHSLMYNLFIQKRTALIQVMLGVEWRLPSAAR